MTALAFKHPLTAARTARKLSLRTFASMVSCDKAHISRIENGKILPSPQLAKLISSTLGGEITRDQLLYPDEYDTTAKQVRKPVRSVRERSEA